MRPILTIGHSTHPIELFITLLQSHQVELLADIRTVPRSRRNPQFNREFLPQSLQAVGIEYVHLAALGGLRKARPDSRNTAWQNASFRGYADHMDSSEFAAGLAALLELAEEKRVAVMCAESVPWQCHRSLVADALTARGVPVEHIMSATARKPHKVTPFAHMDGTRVSYPGLLSE